MQDTRVAAALAAELAGVKARWRHIVVQLMSFQSAGTNFFSPPPLLRFSACGERQLARCWAGHVGAMRGEGRRLEGHRAPTRSRRGQHSQRKQALI